MPDTTAAMRQLLAAADAVSRAAAVPRELRTTDRPVVVRLTLEESHALADALWAARLALGRESRG